MAAKFSVGQVLDVIRNTKAPELVGLAVVFEVRENEPQDDGSGTRNVYRVRFKGNHQCWVREEHLAAPPAPRCSFCGGPTPCTRSD